ncbi:hypothetical protein QVD17_30116 [Tagetes erecta]|uniref:Interactor of constitutive active ROPs 1 n=1 Tax=Tagetes erecta TaxID=13708 RepID=A0AAD8K516_TARER|nr:hypothetical protein QVD17_30116 [Tagetes erecta]
MPRGRGSELTPRVSTRGPTASRTSSSESDPLHHRPVIDRSPKFTDRRSSRSVNSDPLSQKKLGTRIAGLETQLELAQGELKVLKDQLALAEAAKKEAQKELQKRATKPVVFEPVSDPDPGLGQDTGRVQNTRFSPSEDHELNNESVDDNQKETDVFEVPVELVSVEPKVEEDEKPSFEEAIAVKDEELSVLRLEIEEKERKLGGFVEENDELKRRLSEANVEISSAMVKEETMKLTLTRVEEEFRKSQNDGVELKEKLKEVEGAKEALEMEMKKLRVQTEQWKKAADAAAAILSGGVERCGSMDKHYGGVYDGYGGFVGSPGLGDESDDGFGNGKRKGSGIRMFGDLWKKKGQK